MNVKRTAAVTITSDLMCPWCWIGLRKLQKASQVSKIEPKITWKPFQLRPGIPEQGMPKGGTPASRVGSQLAAQGNSVGIDFTGLTDRTPNTVLFHATIKHLQDELKLDPSVVTDFHEAVFEGYFTLGVFPDQEGILAASKTVHDRTVFDHVQTLYENPRKLEQLKKEVKEEAQLASRLGISGVPTFAFGGKTAFSGAQSVDVFTHSIVLEKVVEEAADLGIYHGTKAQQTRNMKMSSMTATAVAALSSLQQHDPREFQSLFQHMNQSSLITLQSRLKEQWEKADTEQFRHQNILPEQQEKACDHVIASAVLRRIVFNVLQKHAEIASPGKVEAALKRYHLPKALQSELYERYGGGDPPKT
ncbi:MAG: hypothetical protein SGARI_002911, partial [Bacillariaceae sp.]